MTPRPILPGFTLGRRLGGGPTSDVFAANDTCGRLFAVKILKPSHQTDGDATTLLSREADAGQAIRHPRIVTYRHASLANDPPFLVIDYLSGETARQRLDRRGPPPLAVTLGMLRQIAEGLAAIHQIGFIHGDIKPANVLITGPGTVKLIDLGFAHRPGDLKPWTDRGHILGTANYLAPELTRLPPIDSPAADLFAFGVMAFELLTGALPYGGRSTQEVIKLRRTCRPAILESHSTRLAELVHDLTQFDPANRPTTGSVINQLAKLQIDTMGRKAA